MVSAFPILKDAEHSFILKFNLYSKTPMTFQKELASSLIAASPLFSSQRNAAETLAGATQEIHIVEPTNLQWDSYLSVGIHCISFQ